MIALSILEEEERLGSSDIKRGLIDADFQFEPPSWRQFVEDPYYAGEKGSTLYPLIKDELEEVFARDCSEVILTGSLGWGKSYAASFGMVYDFLWLSCLRCPHTYCGVAPGTPIYLMNLSVTAEQAELGLYKYVTELIRTIPYFADKFPNYPWEDPRWRPSLPKENLFLHCGGSTEFGAIGHNVIGGALDEANFMVSVRRSRRAQMAGEMDQAKILYDQIKRRRKSRFIGLDGKLPCRFWLLSSVQFPGDFLETQIKVSKNDPDVAVLRHATWEGRKSDPRLSSIYSGREFTVFVGDGQHQSRVVTDDATTMDRSEIEVPPGCQLVDVPIEYIGDFRQDLHGSIRDILGIPTLSLNPFFANPDEIKECIVLPSLGDVPRQHPFVKTEDTSVHPSTLVVGALPVSKDRHGRPVPIINPKARRFCHVDLAETGDAAAFAIGHYGGHRPTRTLEMGDTANEDEALTEDRPSTVIDVMHKILPPVGGRIDITGVRNLIKHVCQKAGYRLRLVTYDQYQSSESIAAWNQAGIESRRYSVDLKDEAYMFLRSAVQDRRLSTYDYKPLVDDVSTLEYDARKKKVDHAAHGSKDVSDCVAAICAHVEQFHPREYAPMGPSLGLLSNEGANETEKRDYDNVTAGYDTRKLKDPEEWNLFDE